MKKSKNTSLPIPILAYARTNRLDTTNSMCGSIERQFEAIDYWARYNNCEVVHKYQDAVISGFSKRPPSLIEMVYALENKEVFANYVVVCAFSRISRNITVFSWYHRTIESLCLETISLSESCSYIPELSDNQCNFNRKRLLF